MDCAFLDTPQGRRLAFRRLEGSAPTLLFLPGYASDMGGTKALALEAFARDRGLAMLRFDYSGTGQSPGLFADGTLDAWLEDAEAAARAMASSLTSEEVRIARPRSRRSDSS